jgi:hypothetical protein
MPVALAWRGTLGSWAFVGNEELTGLPFFRSGMGFDNLPGNLRRLAEGLGWYAVVGVAAVLLSLACRRLGARAGRAVAVIAFLVTAGGLAWFGWRRLFWFEMARPLPAVMALCGVMVLIALLRRRENDGATDRLVLSLSLLSLSFVLLLKMMLNARVYHYGFALAMPGTLLLVVAALGWLPAWVGRLGGRPEIGRAVMLAVVAVAVAAHLRVTNHYFARRTTVVGIERDAFRADDRGSRVNSVLDHLGQVPSGSTVVVVPEGVMINYLARRRNPTPFLTFLPPDLILFGEERMLESFEHDPPDYVVRVCRNTSEYGARSFGFDYGRALDAWIRRNYRGASPVFGDPQSGANGAWMAVLARRDSVPQSGREGVR